MSMGNGKTVKGSVVGLRRIEGNARVVSPVYIGKVVDVKIDLAS